LGTLESKGCKYSAGGGVLKVSKGSWILLKGLRHRSLYVLQAPTTIGYMKKGSYKSSPRAKFKHCLDLIGIHSILGPLGALPLGGASPFGVR